MKHTVTALLLFAAIASANAQDMRSNNDLVISQPVYHDLYITGGTITVNAPVHGDLIISGGTVTVNDSVANDILIAGGRIVINGPVGDDIRGVSVDAYINNVIGGDLAIAGRTVTITSKTVVGGDALLAGGTVIMNGLLMHMLTCRCQTLKYEGITDGDADCRGGTFIINGTIKGNSQLSANEIILGDDAAFYDNVNYWSRDRKLNFGQTMKHGTANYKSVLATSSGQWLYLGFSSGLAMIWYLCVVFLFILMIEYLFTNTMKAAADETQKSIAIPLVRGLIYFIGVPIAICLLLITIIGIPLGILLLFFYIIIAILASVISAVFIGNWFNNRYERKWSQLKISLVALLAFVLLKLFINIPIFGWFILFVIITVSFGSIGTVMIHKHRNKTAIP